MARDIDFDTEFSPAYGNAVTIADGVQRLTVNNPSPFTFYGTNSYIVGKSSLAIIDPGPDDEAHFDALMKTIDGRTVSHIFVSHTHRDHSPLARRLKDATGALTVAEGPHRAARPLHEGPASPGWIAARDQVATEDNGGATSSNGRRSAGTARNAATMAATTISMPPSR